MIEPIIGTITAEELATASHAGVRRQISALILKRKSNGPGDLLDHFAGHILGCMCELVAAKKFNLFWPDGVGFVRGDDVGRVLEVRGRRNGAPMYIKADHKPLMPYLLIHPNLPKDELPTFLFYGWIYGGDAWEVGEKRSDTPDRVVPLKHMRPVSELFSLVEALRLERPSFEP